MLAYIIFFENQSTVLLLALYLTVHQRLFSLSLHPRACVVWLLCVWGAGGGVQCDAMFLGALSPGAFLVGGDHCLCLQHEVLQGSPAVP